MEVSHVLKVTYLGRNRFIRDNQVIDMQGIRLFNLELKFFRLESVGDSESPELVSEGDG